MRTLTPGTTHPTCIRQHSSTDCHHVGAVQQKCSLQSAHRQGRTCASLKAVEEHGSTGGHADGSTSLSTTLCKSRQFCPCVPLRKVCTLNQTCRGSTCNDGSTIHARNCTRAPGASTLVDVWPERCHRTGNNVYCDVVEHDENHSQTGSQVP